MTEQKIPGRAHEPPIAAGLPDEPYYRRPQPAGPNRRAIGALLLLVGLIWLISALLSGLRGPLSGGPLGTTTMLSETVAAQHLTLDAASADVEVERWAGDEIRVEAIRRGGTAEDFTIDLRRDGDTLRLSTSVRPCFLICNRDLTYRIALPASASAAVTSSSGDVRVVEAAGGVVVRTTSGDISLVDVGGAIDLSSISGDISMSGARTTRTTISSTSGEIEIDGAAGPLSITSISGDIDISEARDAQLTLSSTSGDISYSGGLAPEGASAIDTISGTVAVALPEDGSIAITASSISGDVESDISLSGLSAAEHTLSGKLGAGAATLKISTTSGDISIGRQ